MSKANGNLAEQPVTRGGEEGLPSTATGLSTKNARAVRACNGFGLMVIADLRGAR